MNSNLIVKRGYLYSLWGGHLKVYEGQIHYMIWNQKGGFTTNSGKRFQCSVIPGVVSNAMVWLEEDDELMARNILISNEREKVSELQDKIENHLRKIKMLEANVNGTVE